MFFVQKNMVNCKTYTMSNGNNSTFAPSASSDFTVFSVEVTVLVANSGMGTLN